MLILYKVPVSSRKFEAWSDGFVKGLDVLRKDFGLVTLNIAAYQPTPDEIEEFDCVVVKANWGWGPDCLLRGFETRPCCAFTILVSGVASPPPKKEMLFYDAVMYQTEWYRPQLMSHHTLVHAFGIDTEVMRPLADVVKAYDYMTVGAFKSYKRQALLADRGGRRLAVGDLDGADPDVLRILRNSGVEVMGYRTQNDLCKLYNQSRVVYIPAAIHGGGERAVLEARACGASVEVEQDNPKLVQLCEGPVWDHLYYGSQVSRAVRLAIENRRAAGGVPVRKCDGR